VRDQGACGHTGREGYRAIGWRRSRLIGALSRDRDFYVRMVGPATPIN
jgi:hypothetical protein